MKLGILSLFFVHTMYAPNRLHPKNATAVAGISVIISFFRTWAEFRLFRDRLIYLIVAILRCIITDTAAFFVGRV